MSELNLDKGISQLLYDHDCVIVPDFGGFIASYKPAFVHEATHTLHPPSKQVGFNKNLVSNDGLVANYFVRHDEVDFDEAMSFIQDRVVQMKKDLEDGKRIDIREVGVLYKDDHGALQFVPDESVNYLRESFGLKAIGLVVPTVEKPEEETPVIPLAVEQEEEVQPEKKRRSRAWVAAAIALPILLGTGWTLGDFWANGGQINTATLNPFSKQATVSDFQPRFPEEALYFDYEEGNTVEQIASRNPELTSFYFSFPEDKISPDGIRVVLNEEAEAVPEVAARSTSLKLYFVVGGAFAELSNAEKMVAKLQDKGFDASIFGKHNGLNLVCYGSYTNRASAKAALSEIKQSENKHAWLKRH